MVLARLHGNALEADIGRIGREIFKRAESAAPSIFSMEAWQQFAMNWMTQDEDLKLRLFRFIEVMPSLKDSAAIARHLDEYLRPHESNGHSTDRSWPPIIDLAVSFRRHDSAYAKLVAWGAMFGCGQSARHFIVGATPAEAIASVRKLRRKGMTFTLDVLGETIIADRVALHHQEIYLNLLRHLGRESREWPDVPVLDHAPWGSLPKVNISIKLSAIVAKFDPIDPEGAARAALDRLRPVLRCARETGAFINVDMEHYAVKDLTLDIFKRVLTEPEFRDWPDVGIVIQTYMPEGERDMRELIEWTRSRGTPITVRIVKGAYWDSETANAKKNRWPNPLYEEKWESDASFERVSELLLRNADVIRPAFASHNVRSIAAVLAMESALGLPPRTLELQMLTGMGDQLKRAVVSMGQRLRVYAPCGDMMTGMAYLIRRLIENTANESFLRQSFGQQVPIDRLLAKPGTARLDNSESQPVPSSKATSEQDADSFVTSADIDFSREANRQAMRRALAEVRSQFGRKHPAIIGNGGVDTRIWHDSLNPSNPAEVVGRTAVCDHALADRGVHAAREALPGWSSTTPSKRAAVFRRPAILLDERRFELCAWMTMEVGKTWRESQGDFMEAADYLRFYAHEMERAGTRPVRDGTKKNAGSIHQFPKGVAVVIAPFTSPLSQPCSMIAGALSAGATVIFKPAGDASVCGAKLCEILIEAGLPPGVLNYVPGNGSDLGDFLVVHPGVDAIAFTGSIRVGRRVIERAQSPVDERVAQKKVIAEMSGKNSIIVDDDADLDEAAQATMASAFGFSGQNCTACSHVIVVGDVYAALLEKLIDASSAIRPGPADSPATTVGPLINAMAVASAKKVVDSCMGDSRCVLPMKFPQHPDDGFFVSPAIFADVTADAAIAQEECMAPVLGVMRAGSFDEAVAIANRSTNAHWVGVYSRSPRNIEFAKRRLRSGDVQINRKITLSRVGRRPVGVFGPSDNRISSQLEVYQSQLAEQSDSHGSASTAPGAPFGEHRQMADSLHGI